MMAPILDKAWQDRKQQVRFIYKFFPLSGHPHGEIAARAAMCAMRQGKFWEMHHKLFDNQERLERQDLEEYAKDLGLDLAKFRSDFGSKEVTERIEKDKAQAEQLGLDGTPFIFVNGRYVDLKNLTNAIDDIPEWVKLDIELSGQALKPAKEPKAKEPKDEKNVPAVAPSKK